MNLIDRTIAYFSPARALRREAARQQLKTMQSRSHDAAQRSRRIPGEFDRGGSANEAVGSELDILRRRSIQLLENSGFATQAQNVMANGIVGKGIRVSVKTTDKALEDLILGFWNSWADSRMCDHAERLNFYAIQQQVIRAVFSTGEAIVRRRRVRGGSFQLQVQEGDYIDMSHDGQSVDGGGYVQHGIEYDAGGKVVAYWLYDSREITTVNGIDSVVSKRIPAGDVIHVYYADRAGRKRGLPWLRQSYMKFKDAAQYTDAEMQGKIVSACHAAFVSGQPSGDIVPIGEDSEEYSMAERLQPGMIYYARPGEQVSFNNPTHSTGYDEFMNSQLREAAAGVGASFESITGNYSQVNFSSGRMGWIEASRTFEERRGAVMDYFIDRVWEWFMESLVLRGLLPGGMNKAQALAIGCDKTAPRREMLDPVKETKGMALLIGSGLISWQEAVRQLGGDPDDVAAELKTAIDEMKAMGFTPEWFGKSQQIPQSLQSNE